MCVCAPACAPQEDTVPRIQGNTHENPRKPISSKRKHGLTRSSSMRINGKTLTPSHWNVMRFMLPFLAWNAALIVIYAISLFKLQGMQVWCQCVGGHVSMHAARLAGRAAVHLCCVALHACRGGCGRLH